MLGLFATITGIFAERLASVYERKRELLLAFYGECIKNSEILKNRSFNLDPDKVNGPIVFPRLIVSVSEAAIISGAFEEAKYREISSYIYEWRDTANEFNHRLDITELITFTNPSSIEPRSFYVELISSGKIDEAIELNQIITHSLKTKYLRQLDTTSLDLVCRHATDRAV
ncbi:MAG: hypothetical protein ACFB2W_27415 [Leptolyngbyaceae cyanobacterium]